MMLVLLLTLFLISPVYAQDLTDADFQGTVTESGGRYCATPTPKGKRYWEEAGGARQFLNAAVIDYHRAIVGNRQSSQANTMRIDCAAMSETDRDIQDVKFTGTPCADALAD